MRSLSNYGLIFGIVLSSGTFFAISFLTTINAFMACASVLSLMIKFSDSEQLKINVNVLKYMLSFILILIANIALMSFGPNVDQEAQTDAITFVVRFIVIFLALDYSRCWKAFSNIIIFISTISLFLYFLKYILPREYVPVWQVGSVKTSYLITTYGLDFFKGPFIRNSSIFYEPGLYGVYLVLVYAYEKLKNKKLNPFKRGVIIISTISTFSPPAIILLLFTEIALRAKNKNSLPFLCLIAVPVLSCIAFYFISLKSDTTSFYLRVQDIFIGLKLFTTSPIIGHGLLNENLIKEYFLNTEGMQRGLSNGLLTLLYQGGLFVAIYYIYPLVYCIPVRYFEKNKVFSLFLLGSFLFFQPIVYSNVMIFLVCYGVVRRFTGNASKIRRDYLSYE